MKRIDQAKLACAIVGIAIWAYGARTDARNLEWLGVGMIAIAFLLRFLAKGRPPTE